MAVSTHHRYLYRGYLQIPALDLTRTTLNAIWYILWNPTEAVATRLLAIQTAGSCYTYGLDLTKNVTDLHGQHTQPHAYNHTGKIPAHGAAILHNEDLPFIVERIWMRRIF